MACLLNYAGDGCYKAEGHSLGAGAQNGAGLFLDGANDRLKAGQDRWGLVAAFPTEEAETPATVRLPQLSIFIKPLPVTHDRGR